MHLPQALANRGRRGRKKDFSDAERLVAQELTLSFVPDAEQRLGRTVMRGKYQLTRHHTRIQNRLEALLEEAHIELSSLVSDLLGISARRMLQALADGEIDPAALAAMADKRLRATSAQLCDALCPAPSSTPSNGGRSRWLWKSCNSLSNRSVSWTRRWRVCSASIRMQ
jgi:transposase